MRLRPAIFTVHLWLGFAAAICIVILGVTGAIMAFEPELLRLSHPHLSYVHTRGAPLPLASIGEIVQTRYPGDAIRAFQVPVRAGFSMQVITNHRVVYIDPAIGDILGETQGSGVMGWIHQVHTHLNLPRSHGSPGRILQNAATVILLLMLVSGIYLWWPLKRISVQWGASRRTWFDLHNAIGVLALPFVLILAGTGVMMGFEATTTPLFYRLTGSAPTPRPDLHVTVPPGARPIGPDSAMTLARAAIPGATPFMIGMPSGRAYDIRARFPEDRTPGGRSFVSVDPNTGAVLFAQGSRSAPAGSRLVVLNRALHTGDFLGTPSKIVMSVASLLTAAQVLTGVLMWWKRRRRAGAEKAESLAGNSAAV